jgi:hypothetical protein
MDSCSAEPTTYEEFLERKEYAKKCIDTRCMNCKIWKNYNIYYSDNTSALFDATMNRKYDSIRLLLEMGANPDVAGAWDGKTPTQLATELSDLTIMEMFSVHRSNNRS